MFVGAELLRYAEGDGEHAGNVMAVFRTPEGHGLGLTFREESTTTESVSGETVRRIKIGSGLTHGKAFVLFENVDPATEKLIVRNTAALGVRKVALGSGDTNSRP